jgi:hypothetical protein
MGGLLFTQIHWQFNTFFPYKFWEVFLSNKS